MRFLAIRLVFLLAILGALVLASWPEHHGTARAEDVAGTSTVSQTCAPGAPGAPVGSCARCGRTVWSAATSENCVIHVYDRRCGKIRWSGCLDCLYNVLDKNP